MRIGVDVKAIFERHHGGIGRTLDELYRALPIVRPGWEFVFYFQEDKLERKVQWPENVRTRQINMPGYRFNTWFNLRLPWAAWRDGVDLLYCHGNACPRWCPVPALVAIHDLIPLKNEQAYSVSERKKFLLQVTNAARKARRIIAVSEHTKQDLVEVLGLVPDRVDVVYWAARSGLAPGLDSPDIQTVKERYGINGRFIISLGGRRKNADRRIRAFGRLPSAVREGVKLVVVGVPGAQERDYLSGIANEAGVGESCPIFGFVSDHDLASLMSGAEILLFVSIYEGFGLPILEAFRCGTPVLASSTSSMPEIAGNAAVYCNPTDVEDIAAQLCSILEDKGLRRDLVARGFEREKRFSWKQAAESVACAMEKCLEL